MQAQLSNLINLDLINCDVTKLSEYRDKVFELLPSLKYLDGFDQNEQEEDDCKSHLVFLHYFVVSYNCD